MTQASNPEVIADVSVRCGFCEKIRIEEHVVGERRLVLRVYLDHHVRQVTVFARHYYLQHKSRVRLPLLHYIRLHYVFLTWPK